VGGKSILLLAAAAPLLAATADTPLFPTPLHLVRQIEDPIANMTIEVDEYCSGNRIISVRADKTVIVDYDRQEMLEIDRSAGTYSVARFEEIARMQAIADPPERRLNRQAAAAPETSWKTTALGAAHSPIGRSADAFEIVSSGPEPIRVEVAVDRALTLSRAALDALAGSAYPNRPSAQQEAVARACLRSTSASADRTPAGDASYGLPLAQTITIQADPKTRLTVRNVIVRINHELPPPEVLAIPAGAKLVESRAATLVKSLEEIEQATPPPRP
jgi:hypothetical protein